MEVKAKELNLEIMFEGSKQEVRIMTEQWEIQVYLDDGRVFYYKVETEEKVREHASAIVKGGYMHNDGKAFEHYGPHRILKVKSKGISTMYPDKVKGT